MTPQAIHEAAERITERLFGTSKDTVIILRGSGYNTTYTKEQVVDIIVGLIAQKLGPCDETESELHKIAAAPKSVSPPMNDDELHLLCGMIYQLDAHKTVGPAGHNRVLTYLYSRYFTP